MWNQAPTDDSDTGIFSSIGVNRAAIPFSSRWMMAVTHQVWSMFPGRLEVRVDGVEPGGIAIPGAGDHGVCR